VVQLQGTIDEKDPRSSLEAYIAKFQRIRAGRDRRRSPEQRGETGQLFDQSARGKREHLL
jgi:hypothetical protein